MKHFILPLTFFFSLFIGSNVMAQDSTMAALPQLDKSPMDMSYFPVDYPINKLKDKLTLPLYAKVIYSRPQKAGRVVFGNLVEYGKVWRLGANEATEIEFFNTVYINGVMVKKGKYSMYAIPTPTNWTFILNRDTDSWGSFRYTPAKDVVRMTVPVTSATTTVENFSLYFKESGKGFNLVAAWDNVTATLPITYK